MTDNFKQLALDEMEACAFFFILRREGGNGTQQHTQVQKLHAVIYTAEQYMSPQTHVLTIDVGLMFF